MTEKKVKFTVIDAVIILAVIIAVGIGVVKILPKFLNNSKNETVEFTVLVQNKDSDFADAITIGDSVTISLTEKDGGKVKEVKSELAKTLAYNSIENTYSNEVIEGKTDVYITIEADTSVSDLAVKAGGTAIKVGTEIPVRGKGYASMGYVIEIDD